jgi:pyruvate dehydrogenase E1 component
MDDAPDRDPDPTETTGWIESFDAVIREGGPQHARDLLARLIAYGYRNGVTAPFSANTPYVNTIAVNAQPPYPGDRTIERRLRCQIRWNAAARSTQREARDLRSSVACFPSVFPSATAHPLATAPSDERDRP